MRDVRKVKDRLELRLDSQQVFFLFAGILSFSALVFVLGIFVGKAQRPAQVASADAPPTLPTQAPVKRTVAQGVKDRTSKQPVEAIYKLDEPGNPNSIKAAIPRKPVKKKADRKPAATPVARATPEATAQATPAAAVVQSTPVVAATSSAGAKRRYTVQIAAYTESTQASDFVRKLREEGFEAYTVKFEAPDGPTYHRVRVGRYGSKDEAEQVAAQVGTRIAGVKPAVMRMD